MKVLSHRRNNSNLIKTKPVVKRQLKHRLIFNIKSYNFNSYQKKLLNNKTSLFCYYINSAKSEAKVKSKASLFWLFTVLAINSIGLTACTSLSSESTSDSGVSVDDYVYANSSNTSFKATDADKIAEIRTRMAAQHISDNQLDAAQRQLEKAFAANNHYAPAYDMMGTLLQKEGSASNIQKAEGFYKKAISLDPNFMQARNNYGVYLSYVGRNNEAIKQFEIAGATLGYDGRVGALENLGRTAAKVGDTELATQSFIRALDANRNSLAAHIGLVDTLLDSGRLGQAQNLYDETLILLGNDANKVPRILMQGIRLAHAQNDFNTQEELSQLLLANFPLSEEAKKLKVWIRNPEAPWK